MSEVRTQQKEEYLDDDLETAVDVTEDDVIRISQQSREKRQLSERLSRDVEEFLANGGQIQQGPDPISAGRRWPVHAVTSPAGMGTHYE